jgi:hypothetical protein
MGTREMKKILILLFLPMMAFGADLVIPKGEWVMAMTAAESGSMKSTSGKRFFWAESTTKPDYIDCRSGVVAKPTDPPHIGAGAHNNIFVCYESKGFNHKLSINKTTDNKFGR